MFTFVCARIRVDMIQVVICSVIVRFVGVRIRVIIVYPVVYGAAIQSEDWSRVITEAVVCITSTT